MNRQVTSSDEATKRRSDEGEGAAPFPRRTALRRSLVIFSQTFVPDPAAVGQHIADVAFEMARRGHRVRVYTANRGYEDTSLRYPPRENLRGVEVRRLPLSSFGKKSILTRIVGTLSFMIQCMALGLFLPRVRSEERRGG